MININKENLKVTVQFLCAVSILSLVTYGLVTLATHKIETKKTPYQFVNDIQSVKGAGVGYTLVEQGNVKVLNVILSIDSVDENAVIPDLNAPFMADCASKKYDGIALTFTKGGKVLQIQSQGCMVF